MNGLRDAKQAEAVHGLEDDWLIGGMDERRGEEEEEDWKDVSAKVSLQGQERCEGWGEDQRRKAKMEGMNNRGDSEGENSTEDMRT